MRFRDSLRKRSKSLRQAPATRAGAILPPTANLLQFACLPCNASMRRARQSGKPRSESWTSLILHNALYGCRFPERRILGHGGTAAVVCGPPAGRERWAFARIRQRGIRRSSGKARERTKQAVDSAIRADSKETGAIWWENAALREAAFGNSSEAKQAAGEGLKLYPASQGVQVEAALAYAHGR